MSVCVCVNYNVVTTVHYIYLPNDMIHLEPQDYITLGKEINCLDILPNLVILYTLFPFTHIANKQFCAPDKIHLKGERKKKTPQTFSFCKHIELFKAECP